jgi:methionine aminotransferase
MNATTAPTLQSKLPCVGTTIFSVMSALAAQHNAVNLGQGFPDFNCDPSLIDAVTQAMKQGLNQYPPMPGVAVLRDTIASKTIALHDRQYCATSEITITAGATQAIFTALLAVVHPGDEVIVLEPCYDSYVPNIELAGGVAVRVPLGASDSPGSFHPDFDKIAAAITPKTRAIIVNSPHNPSGTVWTQKDMLRLQDILAPTDVLLISDEVYEHMVFDGQQHHSAARYPGLGGARLHCVELWQNLPCHRLERSAMWRRPRPSPPSFARSTSSMCSRSTRRCNTPWHRTWRTRQPYLALPTFYQRKRDLFRAGLARTKIQTAAL